MNERMLCINTIPAYNLSYLVWCINTIPAYNLSYSICTTLFALIKCWLKQKGWKCVGRLLDYFPLPTLALFPPPPLALFPPPLPPGMVILWLWWSRVPLPPYPLILHSWPDRSELYREQSYHIIICNIMITAQQWPLHVIKGFYLLSN